MQQRVSVFLNDELNNPVAIIIAIIRTPKCGQRANSPFGSSVCVICRINQSMRAREIDGFVPICVRDGKKNIDLSNNQFNRRQNIDVFSIIRNVDSSMHRCFFSGDYYIIWYTFLDLGYQNCIIRCKKMYLLGNLYNFLRNSNAFNWQSSLILVENNVHNV